MKPRKILSPLMLVTICVAVVPSMTNAQDVLHGRISYNSGAAMVKGVSDADWSYAKVNTLVLPGDVLWADKGGTLELELPGGTFVRMADGSKAEVVSLSPSGVIRGWTGSFYVQRIARSSGDFVFETPACIIAIERDSHVRVDVVGEGATTVSVHWGRAKVNTQKGGAVIVAEGQEAFVDPGFLPSTPALFDRNVEDDFDVWSRQRAEALATGAESFPVTIKTVPMGVQDLEAYGEWIYVDSRPCWHPTVVVDYVPYRSGYWSYVPSCGYVWVGDYPFSYVTCHYGRWTCHPVHGWLWSYSEVWGPAWVMSVRCGPSFVWCPLDPYDRPVFVTGQYWDFGGMRLSMGASTYCLADELLVLGPCPVYTCGPTIFSNVDVADMHIWNIYAPGARARRVPYFGSAMSVRDYSPRRVIRGPDIAGPNVTFAGQHVATLEQARGKRDFASVEATGIRQVRTPDGPTGRSARIHAVTMDSRAVRWDKGEAGSQVETARPLPDDERGRVTRSVRVADGAETAGDSHADWSASQRARAVTEPEIKAPEAAPASYESSPPVSEPSRRNESGAQREMREVQHETPPPERTPTPAADEQRTIRQESSPGSSSGEPSTDHTSERHRAVSLRDVGFGPNTPPSSRLSMSGPSLPRSSVRIAGTPAPDFGGAGAEPTPSRTVAPQHSSPRYVRLAEPAWSSSSAPSVQPNVPLSVPSPRPQPTASRPSVTFHEPARMVRDGGSSLGSRTPSAPQVVTRYGDSSSVFTLSAPSSRQPGPATPDSSRAVAGGESPRSLGVRGRR